MREDDLLTLVRSMLLAGLPSYGAWFDQADVRSIFQPLTVGVASGPVITMQPGITRRRYGAVRREEIPAATPGDDFTHRETQWWEDTMQIGAMFRRDPTSADFATQPSAADLCRAASDILQSDVGLAALAVQRVRPLRVTDLRQTTFINESTQYERWPSFDITFVYPQIVDSSTPSASSISPAVGSV